MAKVTLFRVWKATSKRLSEIIITRGLTPHSDTERNRLIVAKIYASLEYLSPEETKIVLNPKFIKYMKSSSEGKRRLL